MNALKVDSLVRSGDSLMRVTAVKPQHTQVILEGASGETLIYQFDDFNNKVARGELCPIFEESTANAQLPVRSLTQHERQVLDSRLNMVNEVKKLQAQGCSWKEINDHLLTIFGSNTPSVRTIQRWLERANLSVGVEALAPYFSNRGRLPTCLNIDLSNLIIDELEKWYISTDRFKAGQITLAINVRLRAKCEELGVKFTGVSRRTITRYIANFAVSDLARGRLDPRTLRHALRGAFSYLSVERPYQRVELDATPLDIFAVDSLRKVIGRPTLYLVVDCATRCVIGIHLTIQPESQIGLLRTLISMFEPKDKAYMERYNLERSLPAPSMFNFMVVDNSAAHHGDAMRRAVVYLGALVEFTEARVPQQKPFVERKFGTLKTGLIEMLRGATKSQEPLEDEALGRAMREACYTLEELEGLIIRWVAEVYMDKPIESLTQRFGHPCSPRRAMKLLAEKYPLLPPPTPQAFEKACLNFSSDSVRLTQDGVKFGGFQFNSDVLYELFMASPVKSRVEVRSHPLDVSKVYVVDPRDQKSLVVADNKLTGLPAMSFETAKSIRQSHYKSDAELSAEDYAQSYVKLMDDVYQSNKSKKLSIKRSAVRTLDKQQASHKISQNTHTEAVMPEPVEGRALPELAPVATRKKGARP
jgi:putative transposase